MKTAPYCHLFTLLSYDSLPITQLTAHYPLTSKTLAFLAKSQPTYLDLLSNPPETMMNSNVKVGTLVALLAATCSAAAPAPPVFSAYRGVRNAYVHEYACLDFIERPIDSTIYFFCCPVAYNLPITGALAICK